MADQHPLPVGTRVRHSGQQWRSARRYGTGEIIEVKGPYHDGAYEYLIRHDPGATPGWGSRPNSWWASYRTVLINKEETRG